MTRCRYRFVNTWANDRCGEMRRREETVGSDVNAKEMEVNVQVTI
jgi:hypothetical protein